MQRPSERLIRISSAIVATWLCMLALVLAGCDGSAPSDPPDPDAGPRPCVPGELTLDDGTCQEAGLPPDMPCPPGELLLDDSISCQKAGLPDMPCPPGELLLDNGTCQKAGVPASACGDGFMPDGKDGCEPILPADPCPEGMMAVPGDTACREVAPCGSGTWGDIPVEANTQFVDKSYAGGDSDGTQAKPWKSIQKGATWAEEGAIVAVAAGSYAEDVLIQGKAVRLWGRCPAMVEVVGTGGKLGAIQVLKKSAGGAEIHGVAVTGPTLGILVSGASDVIIDGVRIHDTGYPGLAVQDDLGPTSVMLEGSLIEKNHTGGVVVAGSDVTIDAAVIRSTLPDAQGSFGRGLSVYPGLDTQERGALTIHNSLIEQNREIGVFVLGSDATIESTVVRSTLPNTQGSFGQGITIQDESSTGARANVTIRACLVEQNQDVGVNIAGSDVTIEATVVRSTLPTAQGGGRGIMMLGGFKPETRPNVSIRACLIEQNLEAGLLVAGSDATIESTVVRSTLAGAHAKEGRGIMLQSDPQTKRANVTVRACLVEQNQGMGVGVGGADAIVEATLVRSTLPDAQGGDGRGINIEGDPDGMERGNAIVRASLVEESHGVGVNVMGSDATIESTVVRSTRPGILGDEVEFGVGILIQDEVKTKARANVTVRACLVEQNDVMGIHVEGADATIEASVVRGTQPSAQGIIGRGIDVINHLETNARSNVTIRESLVEQNHEFGVFISGADATIEATEVRSTLPNAQGEFGRGISIQPYGGRANVAVRACLVEQNHEVGVFVGSSDALIEATKVRSTLPNGQGKLGDGIVVEGDLDTKERASAAVRACLVEQNHRVGVSVAVSDAVIDASVVRETAPQESDARFGDGIVVFEGKATIQSVDVTRNARAGVASFGSDVLITGGVLTCNGFDLEGEPIDGAPFSFDGSAGWQCSDKPPAECTELGQCHVETTGIEPPPPPPPADPLPVPAPMPQ